MELSFAAENKYPTAGQTLPDFATGPKKFEKCNALSTEDDAQ